MPKRILPLICLFVCCRALAQPIEWPNHRKAAIVLTYDDALRSQLDVAIPQLRRSRFKATFFLTSDIDSQSIPRWRAVAKKGFELGNHSLFHPCSDSNDNPISSTRYTPQQMVREIDAMNRLLFAVDGKNGRTYAYPCAETTVGGQDYVDTLRRYGVVKYARVGGDTDAVITDVSHLDPLRVPAFGLEDSVGAEVLIDFVKSVEQCGGMGVIMFHGVGGDYITTPSGVHQALLDYLARNRKTIWVATFREAMDFVMKNR
ncbi:polysaccharide deacetylase family protein [Puia dinghuensis]|nr:polysaccharide deacetylase family protein [Puia dinghuensis]